MTVHRALVEWEAGAKAFTYKTYNRRHHWRLDGGQQVALSAAPQYLGDPDCMDPEEAFVGALSSCHLLTFLMVACKRGYRVLSYVDDAEGELVKTNSGAMAITRVTLSPEIEFDGDAPGDDDLRAMHEEAHRQCFIANSVSTEIVFSSS